jgi:hypothetical protein
MKALYKELELGNPEEKQKKRIKFIKKDVQALKYVHI